MSFLNIYVIFNFALLLYSGYIFWRISPDMVKKSEFVAFRTFVVVFAIYLVTNIFWTLQEYDAIQLPRFVFIAICFLSLASAVYNAFAFYAYAMIHFNLSFNKSAKSIYISFIPFLIAFVLLVISLFNGMIFSVTSDNNLVNGPYYVILLLISFIYLLMIVVASIYKAIKTKSKYARKDALSLFACVIFLIIWVIIDDSFKQATILQVAIFSVIFFLYASMNRANINTDALTKIGNRRKADEYISSQLEFASKNSPIYMFMSDINDFKHINDKYSHIEGDDVLVIVANSINNVMVKHKGFVARYGGDEFIWLWKPEKLGEHSPEKIIKEVDEELQANLYMSNKTYRVEISTGYALCDDSKRTINSYIKEADDMMYSIKKEYYDKKTKNHRYA